MSGTWFVGSQHAVLFSLLSFLIFVHSLDFFCVPSTKRNEPLKIMTPFSRYKNCSFFIAQSHRMLKQQHQNNRVKYSKKTHSIKKMIKENQNGTKLYLMWRISVQVLWLHLIFAHHKFHVHIIWTIHSRFDHILSSFSCCAIMVIMCLRMFFFCCCCCIVSVLQKDSTQNE